MGIKEFAVKSVVFALLLILILFLKENLASFASFSAFNIKNTAVPQENITKPMIYFCPRDNCNAALADFLKSAEKSIHCAFFDLNLEDILKVLKQKSKEIEVKLVIDNENYEGFKSLNFSKQDGSRQYMHNKFCIVDRKAVSTGSFNPTFNGAFYNNNNLIIIYSKYLAENYEAEFGELWSGFFGKSSIGKKNKVKYPELNLSGNIYKNYFCPEDDCEQNVLRAIGAAEKSIRFMLFSFTSDAVASLLAEKAKKGAAVSGVVEKSQNNNEYSEYIKLRKFMTDVGYDKIMIDISYDKNPKNMHHKVFIIDDKIVITGSYNPTKNGNENNDENILIIHDKDIVEKYLKEFVYVKGG